MLYEVARRSASGRESLIAHDGLRLMFRARSDHPAACTKTVLTCIVWLASTKHEYQVACSDAGAVPLVATVLSLSPSHGPVAAAAVSAMCSYPKLLPDIVGAFLDAGVVSSLLRLQTLLGPNVAVEAENSKRVAAALAILWPRHAEREEMKAAIDLHVQGIAADSAHDGRHALNLILTMCISARDVSSLTFFTALTPPPIRYYTVRTCLVFPPILPGTLQDRSQHIHVLVCEH